MFSEVGSGLSGPASVPFAILALFASSTVQKAAYAVLAVLLLLFSTYRIWLKEHLELEKEKAKNQKPALYGEILETLIGPCVPPLEPPLCASVVLLTVKAWNTVQMQDFSVYKYELSVTVNDSNGQKTFMGTQGGWTVNVAVGDGLRVLHTYRDALRPMRYLDSQHGAVGFYVEGLPPDSTDFASIVLTLIDAIGGRHPIALQGGKFIPKGIVGQRIPPM